MNVLVVGGDGMIGSALAVSARKLGHTVIATSRKAADPALAIDLSAKDWPELPAVDVAFFCAAINKFAECRNRPAVAQRVNVDAPAELAQKLVSLGARVVMLSTSAVFASSIPQRRSSDAPDGLSAYGQLKAEAERRFIGFGHAGTILRMSKILSSEAPLLRDWIVSLASGKKIRPFSDMAIAPVSLSRAVTALLSVTDQPGIFQLSAKNDMSYADVARYIAERLGAPKELILPTTAAAAGVISEDRSYFTSLDGTELLNAVGLRQPTAEETLDEVFAGTIQRAKSKAD